MARLSDIQDNTPAKSSGKMRLSDIGGERPEAPTGWEKAGAAVRGAATGLLGAPGDIEKFATQDVPQFFGGTGETGTVLGRKTVFPTSKELESVIQAGEKAVGVKPGVRPELESWRTGGEFVGGLIPPGALTKQALSKPIQKAGELISRARGKPLEEALKTATTSIEDISKAKTAETVGKELSETQKLTREQAQRGAAQRGLVKGLEAGAETAKAESVSALNKIAKPTDDYELGSSFRDKLKGVQTRLTETLNKEAEANKKIYFDQAKAQEEAGQFWSQSPSGQAFLRNLKSITDPVNSGKFTANQIGAANKVLQELSGKKVGGKVVRSEIQKLETTIRDLKEFTKNKAFGAEAQMQAHIGEIVKGLEQSVYDFAPHGKVFRQEYRAGKAPINIAEAPVGKTVLGELEGLSNVFKADATAIPDAIFKSPQQIGYLERMGISKKEMQPFAEKYTANQLNKLKTADEVQNWLKSTNSVYLKEFPDVAKKAEDYAKTFANNEKLIAGKTEAAGKIKEAIKAGPKNVAKEIDDLKKMSRETIDYIANNSYKIENAANPQASASAARSYVYGLKERGIIDVAESDRLLKNVAEIERQIKDKTAAVNAMKGVLPYLGATVIGSAVGGYSLNKLIGGLNAP